MSEEPVAQQQVEEAGPGAMLARARAERKMGVAEVAERLKYAQRQIEALEADDYSTLHGPTFIRGMMRGYAKLLEVDLDPILKALDRRNVPQQAAVDLRTQRIPFPESTKQRVTRVYMVLSLVVLGAIGAVLYEWRNVEIVPPPAPESATLPQPAPQVPAPAAQSAEPVAAAEPSPAEAPPAEETAVPKAAQALQTGMKRIQLEFDNESWVEIKDRDGKTLLSQINAAGTQKTVDGLPPFSVVIGNASGVRLKYNNAPYDLRPYVKVEVARLNLE